MNIFYVDHDPDTAAWALCDQHVVKMVLETAQILCTVHDIAKSGIEPPYKPTHRAHPCTLWTASCIEAYVWTVRHGWGLCDEYRRRYGKLHKSAPVIDWAALNFPPLPSLGHLPPPAQAMPDEFRDADPVVAYRRYYINRKLDFARWKHSALPSWIPNRLNSAA